MANENPFTSAKAPAYNLIAPDIGAEQAQLARQQQLADLLRGQALQQDQGTQVVNGWAVKKSPMEAVSKMAQALMGGYIQTKADEKQLGLAKAMQERMSTAFDGMAGGSASTQQSSPTMSAPSQRQPMDPLQVTEGAMDSPPPPSQEAPMQPQSSPQLSQVQQIRNQAKAAWLLGNKELANKLLENISTMTEGQRTDNYLGISAAQSREAELAKRLKEGTMSYQPGQLNVLPNGQKIVAPNFETGVAGGFDAQGNPVANEIKGSTQIAANRAGAVTEATARANAGQRMTTVNIAGRPVMMTEAQAINMANGGAAPAGTQFNNPIPGGMSLDFKGDPQAVFNQISQIKDPAIRAEALQALGQMPAPASSIGIAGSTAAENEQEVGQVRNNLAIEKSRIENAQSPEQQQKLVDAKGVLGLLDAAEPLLANGIATGSKVGAMRDTVTGALGISTDASKSATQLAAIGGALVSKMPKMTGPQSDKDVALYKEMAGKIGDSTVPVGDRQAAAQVIRMLNEKYIAANKGSVANTALDLNTGTPAPYAPKVAPPKEVKFKYLGQE